MQFSIKHSDTSSKARTGVLELPRGRVNTPVFMPVGTLATVKGILPRDLCEIGAQIVLANTYHLMLRPGEEIVKQAGGVSRFMAWNRPVLTDSGGYQVFSLAESRQISDEGVEFKSHVDGSRVFLSPERAVEIQYALNSDIMMALDICPPLDASKSQLEESLEITHKWASRCLARKRMLEEQDGNNGHAGEIPGRLNAGELSLFPIIQGGLHKDLRSRSARELGQLDAPGFAIGGVSVGESPQEMAEVVSHTAPLLPREKPRYLMGVGHPRDILMGIGHGVDMFDCVLPTRNGRNAQALTADGPVRLRNACHARDNAPLEEDCDCYACKNFSRAYIRHLFIAGEMLASILTSLHNIRFLLRLMEKAGKAIESGSFSSFAAEAVRRFEEGARPV